MKKIQVLGTGCAKCERLAEQTRLAAEELGLQYEIETVQDIDRIVAMGALATPALAVDGKIVVSGKIPALEELKNKLT